MYHSPGVSLVSNRLMSSKPISCFLIYCEEKRDSLKRPDRSNSEVTSILGAQWRALDTKTKDTYRAEAHRRKKVKLTKQASIILTKSRNTRRNILSLRNGSQNYKIVTFPPLR